MHTHPLNLLTVSNQTLTHLSRSAALNDAGAGGTFGTPLPLILSEFMNQRQIKQVVLGLMHEHGDTPTDMAALLGFSDVTHIYRCLNPESSRRLRPKHLSVIAEHYDVPLPVITHGVKILNGALLNTALADICFGIKSSGGAFEALSDTSLSAATAILYRARMSDCEDEHLLSDLIDCLHPCNSSALS